MKHSLNLLLLLNSTLFCIVRRSHSISGEDGKHGNHGTASADLIYIFFLTISPLAVMEGSKEKPLCFSEDLKCDPPFWCLLQETKYEGVLLMFVQYGKLLLLDTSAMGKQDKFSKFTSY